MNTIQLGFISILSFINLNSLIGQSIMDSSAVHQFAKFLEKNHLYEYAAEEYERLYFYNPNEISFFEKSFENYRLANKTDLLKQKLVHAPNVTEPMLITYVMGLAHQDQLDQASEFLQANKSKFSTRSKFQRLEADLNILSGRYSEGISQLNSIKPLDTNYINLVYRSKDIPRKSKALAGIMSGIIPGLGRVYAKDYKDGILSLVFVGATGYQAYRRFKERGVKSVGGWIYGGVSLGFYIGNIYGSIQSAKNYNIKNRKQFNESVKSNMDIYYNR